MATMNIPTNDRRHIPERRTSAQRRAPWTEDVGARLHAMALLIIGGLNWAIGGLVRRRLGGDACSACMSPATRLVYLLVGIAALYAIYLASRMAAARQH